MTRTRSFKIPRRLTNEDKPRKWTEIRPKWKLSKALIMEEGKLSANKLVKHHPIFARLNAYFADLIIQSAQTKFKEESEFEVKHLPLIWMYPATSIIIVLYGEVAVNSKVHGPGDCFFPKLFDGASKRMLKVVPKGSTMILDLSFTKYAKINKIYMQSPDADGELL